MFQVEPVLYLQSLESPALTWLMTTITTLGYTPVYAGLLTIVMFGFRLKHGIFVFATMLIGGILTDGLKRGLEFPRPSDVDIRVIEPGHERPPLLVDGGGADSFWALPSDEAMTAADEQEYWSYGLPSGHVSAATAFCLALAFFFRSRALFVFGVAWIFLMALSRMYLGRHFIADIIGGVGVGMFALAVGAYVLRPLIRDDGSEVDFSALFRWAALLLPLVLIAPFFDLLDKENTGRLLGLLATYALLLRVGFSTDEAVIWKRIARVLLAIVVYVILDQVLDPVIDSLDWDDNSFGMLVFTFLITFLSFSGTVLLAQRLTLFESVVAKKSDLY